MNTAAYNKYNAQESPIGHQGRGSLGGLDFLGGGGGGEGLSADVVQQLQLMVSIYRAGILRAIGLTVIHEIFIVRCYPKKLKIEILKCIRFWYKKLKLKTMKIKNTKKILNESFLIYGICLQGE